MIPRVSTSLCRFILESPKVKDTTLFMTILSMDSEALKKGGYNGTALPPHIVFLTCLTHGISLLVDRVLRQNSRGNEPEVTMETSAPQASSSGRKAQGPSTKISLSPTGGTMDPASANTDREQISKRPTIVLNELKRVLRGNPGTPEMEEPPPPYSV
jgi:hypothetical protein